MRKMICFFKKRAGLSDQQFRDYYENNHVPLALKLLPCFSRYTRSYVVDNPFQPFDDLNTTPQASEKTFDVVTEIWFDEADFQDLLKRMADPEVNTRIAADEENFFDRAATRIIFSEEVETPTSDLRPLQPA